VPCPPNRQLFKHSRVCDALHLSGTLLTLFAVSKDKWETKEGTQKSMKNALYAQQYMEKGTSWDEVSDFEQ